MYWILFFLVDLRPTNPPPCYLSFEQAFVLPDLLLAACLCFSGTATIAGTALGASISLPSGGGLIYLGLTDAGFNALNGIYTQNGFQAMQNLAINGWCLAFGATIIAFQLRAIGARHAQNIGPKPESSR